jgi:hypothetical protein
MAPDTKLGQELAHALPGHHHMCGPLDGELAQLCRFPTDKHDRLDGEPMLVPRGLRLRAIDEDGEEQGRP